MTLLMGLVLISCGSSGGGDSPQSPQIELQSDEPILVSTVSGVAATGAAMTGTVTLKDSNGDEET